MSLFQAREWWSAKVEGEEECGPGCMVVGNVDNDAEGTDKIIVGGFSGTLRVYYPRQKDYRIEDLMLEQALDAPILQLLIGQFLPGQTRLGLAVLHPRSLVVYQVLPQGGTGAGANFYTLEKRYEHRLGVEGMHFTAFNMCAGPFGGTHLKDYLCVQSMDGQISFYEHEHFAFTRQLDFVLVPGPICYCKKTDSIITCDSAMHVVSYKYQALASASDARPTAKGEGKELEGERGARSASITSSKRLKVDWKVNVGEHVQDISVARFSRSLSSSQVDIMVVGEHTLFCLHESGGIRMQKRLDYNPACSTVYERGGSAAGGSSQNLIIGTHTKQMMVYRDTALIWAAVASVEPVALRVARFGGLAGFVVALNEGGTVSVTYMGTDPPTSSVAAADAKELNYEEMDEEHRRLLTTIKESQSEHRTEPRDKVLLRAQVPSVLDGPSEEPDDDDAGEGGGAGVKLTVRLYVSYTGADKLSNVNISLNVPSCLAAKDSALLVPSLAGGRTPVILPLVFRPRVACMPDRLEVRVAAAYTTSEGEPRTAQIEVRLPMCIVCQLVPPLKNSTFKFTLDTNKPPPQLSSLFSDMLEQPGLTEDAIGRITASAANVLTFRYYNGADASILVSKSAGRYRVQSGNLQALWMVSAELVRRLAARYGSPGTGSGAGGADGGADGGEGGGGGDGASGSDEPFVVAYQEPLPLADFFACIDEHHAARVAVNEASSLLNDRAHQFRLIQKRLLVRFKDRNPAPLNNLDALLHGTYNQLIDVGNALEKAQKYLVETSNRLSCACYLLLLLMRFRFGLDDNNFEVLNAHLSATVEDNQEQGWEECTDAAMTHLLRTTLAKSQKDSATVPQPLSFPSDTQKLKKHITIVCDRLAKGARLYRPKRPKK